MLQPDPPARLAPISRDEFTEQTQAFFNQWSDGFFQNVDANPVLCTLAHHPALANAFSPLNVHLLTANTLPVKQRQIAIMRCAWLCGATYVWSSHLRTSARCELGPDMYEPVQRGADDPWFTDFERSVIRATDDLVNDHLISDSNWQALAAEWNKQQLLDFMFTVGCYVMLSNVTNSAKVERKQDLLELAGNHGAPVPR